MVSKFWNSVKGFFAPGLFIALLLLSVYAFNMSAEKTALQTTVGTLQTEVGQLGEKLQGVARTNMELNTELELLRKSQGITESVKSQLDAGVKEDKKRYDALSKQVGEKLSAIEAKYSALEPTKDNLDRKTIEISLERSKGVWLMYCLAVVEAKECQQ